VDAGSYSFLEEVGAAHFLRWTESARICFANASEAAVLAGTADRPAQASALTAFTALP
jgi:hypothetical protein